MVSDPLGLIILFYLLLRFINHVCHLSSSKSNKHYILWGYVFPTVKRSSISIIHTSKNLLLLAEFWANFYVKYTFRFIYFALKNAYPSFKLIMKNYKVSTTAINTICWNKYFVFIIFLSNKFYKYRNFI